MKKSHENVVYYDCKNQYFSLYQAIMCHHR